MWLTALILGLVTLQRLAELMISRRNTARLLASGGFEAARGHYWLIVAFHGLWLLGLWILAWNRPVDLRWLFAFLIAQALRGWVIAALGGRWTTGVVVMPGETLISGRYRLFRHPNYYVVAAEVFMLPMVFGLWWYALAFLVANAGLLWWHIRAEDAALASAQSHHLPDAPV